MTTEQLARRTAALKTADAINAIEGVPVSFCWARGELTGPQMKQALLAFHQRLAQGASGHV